MSLENAVILLTRHGMGNGPAELQLMLLDKYLQLLEANEKLPAAICLYTEAVKLVVEGSPVLERLAALERKGVRLIACSTCLAYYGLTDRVKTGIAGSMADILEAQVAYSKVIAL